MNNEILARAMQGKDEYTAIVYDIKGVRCSLMNYPCADSKKEAHDKAIEIATMQDSSGHWAVEYLFKGRQEPLYSHHEFPMLES